MTEHPRRFQTGTGQLRMHRGSFRISIEMHKCIRNSMTVEQLFLACEEVLSEHALEL